ncbi:hypothetical protein GPLA_1830 [Paraglaciecola polaris LMG 21857]|uniref:Uncharacterized protein n=1 Tax=Paraglaciecola polaris LMG 21857 TaxID=1129793 RepID=K6ZR18_9ALTE|nr:hypothetical protein GPLA_1830 [Paraglaciecola polaris LMG 21857]
MLHNKLNHRKIPRRLKRSNFPLFKALVRQAATVTLLPI